MNPTDRFPVSPHAVARDLGDELIVLNLQSGQYYSLNDVGKLVWEQLQQGGQRHTILDAVMATFDVDADSARRDLDKLLEELISKGLIVRP